MTNFIFKSPRRLIKNIDNILEDNIGTLQAQLKLVQGQNRFIRQDLVDVKLMLNRLLIDKHLQHQVDDYFERDETSPQTDSDDKSDLD